MARSRGSARSDVESVVGGSTKAPAERKPTGAVQKSGDLGDLDAMVVEALKGGGHVSACLRGGPLSLRACQTCKDVARECKEGINCRFIAKKIDTHLLANFPKETDEEEVRSEVFRFIKDLGQSDDIRALQVINQDLKDKGVKSVLLIPFIRKHNEIVQKLAFVQQKIQESKTLEQVEAEIPFFLKGIKASCEKDDVEKFKGMFKIVDEFQPFLQAARAEAAEKEDKKKSMHEDSEIVDKFFSRKKFKGDREFTKAFLLMSCKS